jgi:hypothetical protein
LHREIGLKSFKCSGSLIFGIRTMAVSFTSGGINPDLMKALTPLMIPDFRVSQFF